MRMPIQYSVRMAAATSVVNASMRMPANLDSSSAAWRVSAPPSIADQITWLSVKPHAPSTPTATMSNPTQGMDCRTSSTDSHPKKQSQSATENKTTASAMLGT